MKFRSFTFALLTFVFVISCSSDDAGQIIDNTPTTFEIIADSPEHSTLEELLINANLKDVLDSGVYTIFAPNDQAFAELNLNNFTDEEISQLLLNHVLSGKAQASDLANGYERTNARELFTGDNNLINIYINVDGGITLNGASTITGADEDASNGIVHFVDAVIPIPDVTTFIAADTSLSTLFSALTRDDQPDFINILNDSEGDAPFTIFAPNNAAFEALLAEQEIESLEDIETSQLTSTLNSHVVINANTREENFTTGQLNTLGSDINIDAATNTITDQNERNINIIITNIQTGNGVIHTLDGVILP